MASIGRPSLEETDFQNINKVQTFLNLGNNPNTIIGNSGLAPLHLASKTENGDVVKLLLKYGADPNFKDASGLTPLHYAARGRKQGTVGRMLLDYLADPNSRDNAGWTPLHYAAEDGSVTFVMLLLEFNADPQARDKSQNTPAHIAASRIGSEGTEIGRLLLGEKIEIEIQPALRPLFPIVIHGNTLDDSVHPMQYYDSSSYPISVGDQDTYDRYLRRSKYILIQTKSRLSQPQVNVLDTADVTILDYVSKNTYLCFLRNTLEDTAEALREIEKLDMVVYVDIYRTELKFDPRLRELSQSVQADVIFHSNTGEEERQFATQDIPQVSEAMLRDIRSREEERQFATQDIPQVSEAILRDIQFREEMREFVMRRIREFPEAALDDIRFSEEMIEFVMRRIREFLESAPRDIRSREEMREFVMRRIREFLEATPDDIRFSEEMTEFVMRHIREFPEAAPRDFRSSKFKVRCTLDGTSICRIAPIDEVRYIEEVGVVAVQNDKARVIINPPSLSQDAANNTYQGSGQVIAIADTGLDLGTVEDMHPAFGNRVEAIHPLNRIAPDFFDHGTHVCGCAVADGRVGSIQVRGAAPQARLVMQAMSRWREVDGLDLKTPDRLHTTLFQPPYDNYDVRVHSNSWLTEPNRTAEDGKTAWDDTPKYNTGAEEIDQFVWQHPDMVICFCAGNFGGFVGFISKEAAAKNCITVGASENERMEYPKIPYSDDDDRHIATDRSNIAPFSCHGPAPNGRLKPDLVAPGTYVLSARSRACEDPSFPSGDPLWCYMSGTSMATPLVAGCAAVLRQALLGPDPAKILSAALIKALLIHGTTPTENPPSDSVDTETSLRRISMPTLESGYGVVNLTASIAVALTSLGTGLCQGEVNKDNPNFSYNIGAPERDCMVKATLVWSDPPGEELENDLILEVRGDPIFAIGRGLCVNTSNVEGAVEVNTGNVQKAIWHGDAINRSVADQNSNLDSNAVDKFVRDSYGSSELCITLKVRIMGSPLNPQPFAIVWEFLPVNQSLVVR